MILNFNFEFRVGDGMLFKEEESAVKLYVNSEAVEVFDLNRKSTARVEIGDLYKTFKTGVTTGARNEVCFNCEVNGEALTLNGDDFIPSGLGLEITFPCRFITSSQVGVKVEFFI